MMYQTSIQRQASSVFSRSASGMFALITAVSLLAWTAPAPAQTTSLTQAGSSGAQFLKIGVGSRYLGMGEAAVATRGDAFSLYWNPAALTEIEGSQFGFAHTDWILDVSLSYAAYAKRIEGFGVIAFGVTSLNVGEMEITTADNNDTQEGTGQFYDASSYAIEVGFARELTPRFSFGGGAKYIYESIATESATGFAFDMGTILYTGLRTLRLGMNISNLGTDMRFSGPSLSGTTNDGAGRPGNDFNYQVEAANLPLIFRLGVAYDVEFSLDSRVTLASEMKHPNDNVRQGSLGMEYGYRERFFLRSGYKINYDEEGVTLGAGLLTPFGHESHLSIDYAWSDLGRLNSAHRFSVNVGF
ncbi:MAG TPA: PorV/PorQ family protein [candidate division Zixibacteria bacterium]|nr:PorV/PorQ family protein [candidate division Zixibacteria bacterium]